MKTHVVARIHLDGQRATLACGQHGAMVRGDTLIADNGREYWIAAKTPTCKSCQRCLDGVPHQFKGLNLCAGAVRVEKAIQLYNRTHSWAAVAEQLRRRNGTRYQPSSIANAVWRYDHGK